MTSTRSTSSSRAGITSLVVAVLLLTAACQSSTQTPQSGPATATSVSTAPSSAPARTAAATPTTTAALAATTAPRTPSPPVARTSPAARSGCPRPAGSVIRLAPGRGRTVALTFDDGPGPATLTIARMLRSQGVNATFFDTGAHDSAHPEVTRQVSAMGFLVENHSWDHRYPDQTPNGWSVAYLRDQIARTSANQVRVTGRQPCFFRPPGGVLTNVLAAASAEGLSAVRWSVDSLDWGQPGRDDPAYVATIVTHATRLTAADREHPIVLMHTAKASHEPESQFSSYRGNTITALPQIIAWYAARGYRFVNLLGES